MSYLEKLNWPEAKHVSGTTSGNFQPRKQIAKSVFKWLGIFFTIAFFVGGGFAVEYAVSNAAKIHHPYRGVYHIPYSSIEKDLHIQSITISWLDFVNGRFALGDTISIVEGDGKNRELNDPVSFAAYNAARKYLSRTTAMDWVLPSRIAREGKMNTEIVARENFSMAFSSVPYGDFSGSNGALVQGSDYYMSNPFFETDGMQGLTGFNRQFADGETRWIDLSGDIYIFLHPNGKGRRDKTSVELGTPNLEPEESLLVAYYILTNLCDWETGEWDQERTTRLISNQYAAAYGAYLDPKKIEITGSGLNARPVYSADLPVDMTVVAWKKTDKNGHEVDGYDEVAVPLRNSRNELLFFGSLDPTQSIIIPFSYLAKMGQDDPIVLGAKRDKSITYRDILVAQQQVEENRRAKVLPLYPGNGNSNFGDSYLAAYIVKTPSTERLAKEIIGDASTKPEALQKISDFSARDLDYISDKKFDGSKSGNNSPEEIPMTLPMAMLNRGEDCEGHAIAMATLYFSAENTVLGDTSTVAIGTLNFFGRGHAVTLVQAENIPAERVITDPFSNHMLIDGVPFVFVEATGETESLDTKTKNGDVFETDKLHQFSWQEKGYDNPIISVVHGVGTNRTVRMAGVSEFEFDHSSDHSLLSCLK